MMKGQIMDLPILMILVFIIGITLLIIMFIVDSTTSGFEDEGLNSTFLQNARGSLTTFDNSMSFLLVGLIIVLIISAFLLRSHPIFLVVGLFVIAFFLFMAAFLSNFWEAFTVDETFAGTLTSLSTTSTILSNWPLIIFVAFIVLMIALVAKPPGESFT